VHDTSANEAVGCRAVCHVICDEAEGGSLKNQKKRKPVSSSSISQTEKVTKCLQVLSTTLADSVYGNDACNNGIQIQ
jgi:hypothetical protein